MKKIQLTTAETFGMINFEQGINAPAQSKEIMQMIENRKIGQTPKGEASTKELFDAWFKGWDKVKRINMKEKFCF